MSFLHQAVSGWGRFCDNDFDTLAQLLYLHALLDICEIKGKGGKASQLM